LQRLVAGDHAVDGARQFNHAGLILDVGWLQQIKSEEKRKVRYGNYSGWREERTKSRSTVTLGP
jgi:hypothetical protein